jgi:hypothetical protein
MSIAHNPYVFISADMPVSKRQIWAVVGYFGQKNVERFQHLVVEDGLL